MFTVDERTFIDGGCPFIGGERRNPPDAVGNAAAGCRQGPCGAGLIRCRSGELGPATRFLPRMMSE
ncbi:MAG: hypothetical protein K2H79_00100, partial [Bacteroidaceae bacterium]|nr:hypothetical protein [Bacteroidaceae bacterium]